MVDDAPEVRALVRTRLRISRRFEVVGEGADGEEAVALARRLRPAVMLLDVSMPRMDGLEALTDVLEASPETRVVMYSGFAEQGLAEAAVRLGAAGFVQKDEPIEAVPDLVASLLAGNPIAAPEAAVSPGEPAAAVWPGEPAAAVWPGEPAMASPEDRRLLDAHRERFREVFEEAAIGMATMTLTGRIVRANRALAEALGSGESLVGIPYASMLDDGGRGALAAALRRVASAGGERAVVQLEHGLTCRSDAVSVRSTLAPVLDSTGRPLYLFLQLQDLTPQLVAAAELHRSEQRFALFVEAVQDYAIFMLGPDGRVASWNTGAQRIKGYSAEEAIGRHFRMFYPPAQQESRHPEHELALALRDGRYEEEGWRIRKDGSRFWASVVITAVYDERGRHVGFGKVTRDVTERRRLLEELEAANVRLARAAAEQSAFIGVTAHELRGPIGVLAGSAELIAKHHDELEPAERAELFNSMATSTGRVRRMLSDLITMSRLEAGRLDFELRHVAVLPALGAASRRARQQHGEVAIAIDCDPSLSVLADPDRLAQILDNLVGNALHHGAPPLRLGARAIGASVEIRVEDAGSGVPESFRPQLFVRFATSARADGSGVGLFIVRELARAQNGEAWYEPPGEETGAGAFVVTLPCASALEGDGGAPPPARRHAELGVDGG